MMYMVVRVRYFALINSLKVPFLLSYAGGGKNQIINDKVKETEDEIDQCEHVPSYLPQT